MTAYLISLLSRGVLAFLVAWLWVVVEFEAEGSSLRKMVLITTSPKF